MSGSRPGGGPRAPAQRPKLPLLDRLLDSDTAGPDGPQLSAAAALDLLRAAVRRDLEAMLNARRRRLPLPRGLTELAVSPLNYGIPDPTAGAFAIPERRAALVREVEATIRRFEPRLLSVSARLVGEEDELGNAVRLKVDAVLRADPVPEQVSFETLLEPVSRDVLVREG